MTSVPIPTVVPQDAWYMLTTGPVNPSQADSVPVAADLQYNTVTQATGVVGALDGAVIFLNGLTAPLDGGQKWLVWQATSVATPDNVNIFNPFSSNSIPGRWINPQTQAISSSVQTIVNNTQTIQSSVSQDVLVVVNKPVAGPTTLALPTQAIIGQTITVKDGKGDAATNPITITAASVDGQPSFVLAANYGWASFRWTGTQWSQVA